MTYLELCLKAAEHSDLSIYKQLIKKVRIDCGLTNHQYKLVFKYTDEMMMRNKIQIGTKGGSVRLRSYVSYMHDATYQFHYFEEINSLSFYDYKRNNDKGREFYCNLDNDSIAEITFNFNILFPEVPFDFEVLLKLGKIASEVGFDMWYGYEKIA